ncbi:MAG: DUF6494 family protein [Geminicoccaceae bacterium]|nr:DUF6494 family protein [Geminicoccaceae bacterium]MDW8369112.1 DUF6494 family protein [Geminicoccaceae bacterium]
MDEDVFNMSVRKFLKKVGVSGQRAIEQAVRKAIEEGRLRGEETLGAKVRLEIPEAGLDIVIDGAIELQ